MTVSRESLFDYLITPNVEFSQLGKGSKSLFTTRASAITGRSGRTHPHRHLVGHRLGEGLPQHRVGDFAKKELQFPGLGTTSSWTAPVNKIPQYGRLAKAAR